MTSNPGPKMKTTILMTMGALAGSCLFVSAEDKPQRHKHPQREIPPELVAQFDTDGDGKLSEEEREAARERKHKELLEKYDADKDGALGEDERTKMKEDIKAEILKKFDKDGDGKLSEEERAAMPKPPCGAKGRKYHKAKRGRDGQPPASAE